jgi:protein-L-isoaspartate(D-aspartate) O-methyltransferase
MALIDSYRHKGLRRKMIIALREKGIRDEVILDAMSKVPRHYYLDSAFADHAYENKPFPIEAEQTISQPYTVAYMTALLQVAEGQKILEIGTGSGYQACILSELGTEVHSIERHEVLYQSASKMLHEMGYTQVKLYLGDGYAGLPEVAPFDRIIVTAGAPEVPVALRMQLKIGGIMVIPVGKDQQVMMRIIRVSETEWKDEKYDNFKFVPFLAGVNKLKVN